MRCWRGCLSGLRCKRFAYGSAHATATPSSLASVKSRMVYPSGTGLPRLSWKKRPLNGCVCVFVYLVYARHLVYLCVSIDCFCFLLFNFVVTFLKPELSKSNYTIEVINRSCRGWLVFSCYTC